MKDYLFKYLPPERLDVLEKGKIRFTSVVSLNDPYEYLMKLGDSEWFVDSKLGDNGYKFLSLSRNHLNLLMWSHYCDSHKGFLLAFDRNHPYFEHAEAVRYRKNRANLNGARVSRLDPDELIKHVVLEKALDWAYEEEERLFIQDTPQNVESIGTDEWGQPILLNSFPLNSLIGVYMGVRINHSIKHKITGILLGYQNKPKLYQMKTCRDLFAIEAVEVEYA